MKTNLNKLKKFFTELALILVSTGMILSFSANIAGPVYAQDAATTGESQAEASAPSGAEAWAAAGETAGSTSTGTSYSSSNPLIPIGTTGYEALPQLEQTTPVNMLNQFVQGLFRNLNLILGAVAIMFIALSAVKMIIAGDNEEVVSSQKKAITFGIIGLAVIGFSSDLAKVLSVACPAGDPNCSQGGFLSQPGAMIQQSSIFSGTVKIFITFFKYIIGSIAVLMLVRNGIRLVALQGNEESLALDKKNIAFTSVGLVLIIIASTVIDKVLYVFNAEQYTPGADAAINPQQGIQEIIGITNIAVTFIAPIAVLVLIAGAVMYATSAGNEESMNKAKRLITLAVIGMVIIFGAFAIVSTVISGQFNP